MDIQKGRSWREIWGLCYRGRAHDSERQNVWFKWAHGHLCFNRHQSYSVVLGFYFWELPFYNQWESECEAVVTLETEKAEYAFWHQHELEWHLNSNYRAISIRAGILLYLHFDELILVLKSQGQYIGLWYFSWCVNKSSLNIISNAPPIQ